MIDKDGYPTEETLEKIKQFNILKDDPFDFVEYLCDNWVNGYPPEWNKETGCLQLSTGGWSGCEEIIGALMESRTYPTFWQMYWYQSRAGGHHWLKVYRIKS